jgi:hypothetical protein
MNLRFLCAQPANTYYIWQVELLIYNFMSMGINPNMMDIVCSIENSNIPPEWLELAKKYPARFFFYNDTRINKKYISSIRPNIIKQHFIAHPYLKDDAIFYHDCDIVLTKPINWDQFLHDDKWYGSDCRWYIGHEYIISKGQEELNLMCSIININKKLVQDNELNSIGAQYLMKNIDEYYWDKVERDCDKMFFDVTELIKQKKLKDPSHHELQIWCSDMWAVLWNGWQRGCETICHPDFNFSWATSNINDWDKNFIMHNAGVLNTDSKYFYKSAYMTSLPPKDLVINEESCSYKYYELLKQIL